MSLWTATEIAEAVNGQLIGSANTQISAVHLDSRECQLELPALFIALKGERDGHDFIDLALENGATALLVDREIDTKPSPLNFCQIVVDDTFVGLQNLATYAKKRAKRATRIAITGSAGKTTTRDLTKFFFERLNTDQRDLPEENDKGKKLVIHCAEKSHNNHLGVPLTLARMPADTDFAIFELGMNAKGEIADLTKMVQPHIGVLTSIAPAHIGGKGLGTIADIAKAKAELFQEMSNGFAILPENIDQQQVITDILVASDLNVFQVGYEEKQSQTDCITTPIIESINGTSFVPPSEGSHWKNNIALALTTMAIASKSSPDQTAKVARDADKFPLEDGRGGKRELRFDFGSVTLIDESYNANPLSIEKTIDAALELTQSPVIILGDMLELGDNEQLYHAEIARKHFERLQHAKIFLCGERMYMFMLQWEFEQAQSTRSAASVIWAPNSETLKSKIFDNLEQNDVIVIKGSNGSKMSTIVEHLVHLAD